MALTLVLDLGRKLLAQAAQLFYALTIPDALALGIRSRAIRVVGTRTSYQVQGQCSFSCAHGTPAHLYR